MFVSFFEGVTAIIKNVKIGISQRPRQGFWKIFMIASYSRNFPNNWEIPQISSHSRNFKNLKNVPPSNNYRNLENLPNT